MVRLEHVNLVVKEIQPTVDFLLTAFPEWSVRGSGEGMWGSTQRHWVHVGDADYYITLNDQGDGELRDINGITPGLAHLGFEVDNLNGIVARLAQKGFEIDIIGRDHPYRQTVYYCDPAGFQFEFIQYSSTKPEEKNMYGGESGELKQKPYIFYNPMNLKK
jgi:catechol 2,3-dioxygenase-like lactoylglutathione lyase family enzyme